MFVTDMFATGGERDRVPRTTSLAGPSGGVEVGVAALDEAMGWPRETETAPQQTRLHERPWGMSSRFAAGWRGDATRRCECGHERSLHRQPPGMPLQLRDTEGGCGNWHW